MRHAPRHLLLAALLSTMSCSFDPPGLDGGSPRDMPAPVDIAGQGDGADAPDQEPWPPADMSTPDLAPDATPDVDDMPTSLDMSPAGDMPQDQDMPAAEEMGADTPEDMSQDMAIGPMPALCDGNRVDLATDDANCGGCGIACDTSVGACVGGQCQCGSGGGLTFCGLAGVCADTMLDPLHCGQCGFECAPGALCDQGQCVCRAELAACDGGCVELATDPRHCGACGNVCAGDEQCKQGRCEGRGFCGFGWASCERGGARSCILDSNRDSVVHCRPGPNLDFGCGQACATNETCIKADLLTPWQCRPYRVGRGCSTCPCADCAPDDECQVIPAVPGAVWCVDAD